MAFIRPYRASDFEAAAHICRETLAPNLLGSQPAWLIAPYVWTHQYTHLSPDTCFVLDDGSGVAVGYCIGCPDIPSFAASYAAYTEDILSSPEKCPFPKPSDVSDTREPWRLEDGMPNGTCLAQLAWNPSWLLYDGNEDLLGAGYKATMHIDLLDDWQGKGWGRKLIETFGEAVRERKEEATKGIWIGVAADNRKVVPFYEKLGFKEVPGDEGSIRMTKDLA